MRRKSDCGFDSYFVKHVLEILILIYVLYNCAVKFDQQLVCRPKLNFSRMNNFGLTKPSFRSPRRYEFIDRLNVKIRITDKKLWP